MNYYEKEKRAMQKSMLKLSHFLLSAINVVDKTNFQETLHLIDKQTQNIRRKFTNYYNK